MATKSVLVASTVAVVFTVLLGGCASPTELARQTQAVATATPTPVSGSGASTPHPPTTKPTAPSIASPLRIPLPTDQLQGDVYSSGLPRLKVKIARACGGFQCVSVAKVGDSTALEPGQICDTIVDVRDKVFDATVNRAIVSVRPGGTITIVVNARCEDVPPGSPPPETSPAEPTGEPTSSDDPAGSTDGR